MSTSARHFPLTFDGRVALVTGAASGIGEAAVRLLLECGVRVLAVDLREPERVEVGGIASFPVAADVRERSQIVAALAAFGQAPDYLVNCAGILDATGFAGVSRDAFARVLDVNLVGAYLVIDVAREAGSLRSVVNVTSIEATRVVALSDPDPHPAYAASKAALAMLTRTAARALAPVGARVNSIAPGFVLTPMAAAHGSSGALPAALRSRVPLGRFASPRQIAESIAFLLSDQAAYITGSELVVDGGFSQT
jgi:NAD(P)-dependent dehydrogenase (short-subunit alcohol dehydrogenase family)